MELLLNKVFEKSILWNGNIIIIDNLANKKEQIEPWNYREICLIDAIKIFADFLPYRVSLSGWWSASAGFGDKTLYVGRYCHPIWFSRNLPVDA